MHNRIKLHAFFFGKNNERKGKSMIVQLIENIYQFLWGRMDSCSVTRRWKPGTFAAHYIAASSRYRFYDQNKIFTNPSVPGYGQSTNSKQ